MKRPDWKKEHSVLCDKHIKLIKAFNELTDMNKKMIKMLEDGNK